MFSKAALKHFHAFQPARILLPTKPQSRARDCVISLDDPPYLEAEFVAEMFPMVGLDLGGDCIITCESAGTVFRINARIAKVVDERTVRLEAFQVENPPQRRRYFRIDAEVHMRYWQADEDSETPEKLIQHKVNLSGCGLRFSTADPLEADQLVALEVALPDPDSGFAKCVGRVIRVFDMGNGRQEAALDLVEIDAGEQDKIIKFCLAEQRRQLRVKVQVAGPKSKQ